MKKENLTQSELYKKEFAKRQTTLDKMRVEDVGGKKKKTLWGRMLDIMHACIPVMHSTLKIGML